MSFLIQSSYYIIILFSIIGYGVLFSKIFNNYNKNFSLVVLGFLGLFFIAFLSYLTNFFFSHSYVHNIIFHSVGLLIFLKYFNYYNLQKKDLIKISSIFLFIFCFSIMYKTHDDFGWYHLPYTLNVAQNKLQFGLGHFNIGFKTPSSIFYSNSLFYLPYVKFNSFNFTQLYIFTFSLCLLYEKIIKTKKNDILFFFSLLSFVFIIVVFYRLAEHGTDRSGQILMFVVVTLLIDLMSKKKLDLSNLFFVILMLVYIVTIKSYFVIYSLLLLPIIFYIKDEPKILSKIIFSKSSVFIIFFLVGHIFIQVSNTGCLLYPLQITCYENFIWSLDPTEIEWMRNWYELWAKAGATPNFTVEDKNNYVSGLNWVNNWYNTYFFNKISDLFLGIILITLITLFTFKNFKKEKIKFTKKLYIIFLSVCLIFIIWFFKFPQLRYGGFVLLGCLIFFPFTLFFRRKINSRSLKYAKYIILVAIIVYAGRNINRISNEITIYKFEPLKSVNFRLENHNFKPKNIGDGVILNITEGRCWSIDQPCTRKTQIKAIKKNNYIIYFK